MADPRSAVELESRFGIPGAVRFESGPDRLVRAVIHAPQADATVYVHGAHVTHYQPRGGQPVLFLSTHGRFQEGQPIRGGVPIVFPWFGPCRADSTAPAHGFVRIVEWRLMAVRQEPDGAVALTLGLDAGMATHPAWSHGYSMTYVVRVGSMLELTLEIRNPSDRPMAYEEALHTYLAVQDIHQVTVRGLEGTTYIDKTDEMRRKTQEAEPLRITTETDRVYLGTRATCLVDDPAAGRRLVVEKQGSDVTVIWSPWIAKAKALADFGDDEWRRMVCVETANATDHAVRLGPGKQHLLCAVIRSKPL
jgi:glucose-6-phosphate 1-epimerase